MNHLLFIPIIYFIFITTVICLIHTFVPDYPIDRSNIFRARGAPHLRGVPHYYHPTSRSSANSARRNQPH